jgi:3',5'-cyclic AMP phosphodiesterase CpdA
MGTPEDAELEAGLPALVERLNPRVIVVSGDLTHRGLPSQHDRAAALLRGFGRPLFVVPGNHDIPYTFPARFTRTFAEFEHRWGTTEPVFEDDGLLIVGLNSVRPWRHQSGGVRSAQLAVACERLRAAGAAALKVVVLHHHLIGAPWRSRKKPVAHRNRVLASLVAGGADLVLAGHIHQAAVSERREFEVARDAESGVVVATAPGLGHPRPDRRGEARGLHVYDVAPQTIRVETYVWRGADWGLTAARMFPRGREPLTTETVSTRSAPSAQ